MHLVMEQPEVEAEKPAPIMGANETGRASGATGYLLTEEMVGFVIASDRRGTTDSSNDGVLVAFEDVRSAYSRVISRAIRELRQGLEVRSIVLEELERELVRFDPHVVVC